MGVMRTTARIALVLASSFGPALSVAADGGAVPQRLRLELPTRVAISGGWFTMGSNDQDLASALQLCSAEAGQGECNPEQFEDERPAHRVYVRGFAIDRIEVDNAAYARCVNAGTCYPTGSSPSDPRLSQPDQPAVQLSWRDARNYCHFMHGELPTEAQWEYAARGSSKRAFPWGEYWNSRLANYAQADTSSAALDGYRYAAPVGAYPESKSFFGLLNMAGNVWEFVLDRFAGPYVIQGDQVDPPGASSGSERVLRGGSWRSPPHTLRASFRGHMPETEARPDVGMRCAYKL
jgi:sulfatase modifying factor 1